MAWRADRDLAAAPSDVGAFLRLVNEHASFFDGAGPIHVARAPGRLDLMGGIADYSGALVLELPLDVATIAAAQLATDARIVIRSVGAPADFSMSLDALPLDYAAARATFAALPEQQWASYVAGALVVLARERAVHLTSGVRLFVDSTVPQGKGVASSASLEVAAMSAICAALDIAVDCRELAILCQLVENHVVGAPCGVMDQMTAACGEANHLLALLCQPAELQGSVPLPKTLSVWGVDSGVRHAVTGSDYGAVRVGAFMGHRIIAELSGRTPDYLANIGPAAWLTQFRDRVPVEMAGAEFLERFGGTADPVTRVDPQRRYAVRQPTAHPIHEHDRVRRFRDLLERESRVPSTGTRAQLGALMYESHASYGACGLGTHATDRIVQLVREAPEWDGLYGAKITGGGSGGVVAVLAAADASDAVHRIAQRYEHETGRGTAVLGGSSLGAAAFGTVTLRR